MKQLTLTGILRRSLLHRRARSISALVALTVSAGVATALLTLYADLDNKLHKEFRSFGANIVVTAPNNAALSTRHPRQRPASRRPRSPRRPLRLRRSHHRPRHLRRRRRHRLRAVRRLDSWWQVNTLAHQDPTPLSSASEPPVHRQRKRRHPHLRRQTHHPPRRGPPHAPEETKTPASTSPSAAFTSWTGTSPTVIEVQVPGGAAESEAASASSPSVTPFTETFRSSPSAN